MILLPLLTVSDGLVSIPTSAPGIRGLDLFHQAIYRFPVACGHAGHIPRLRVSKILILVKSLQYTLARVVESEIGIECYRSPVQFFDVVRAGELAFEIEEHRLENQLDAQVGQIPGGVQAAHARLVKQVGSEGVVSRRMQQLLATVSV